MSDEGLRLLARTNPPQHPDRHTYMRNQNDNCWANSVLFVMKFIGVGHRKCDREFETESQVQKHSIELLRENWARIEDIDIDQRKDSIVTEYKKVSKNSDTPFDSAFEFFEAIAVGVPSCSPNWCIKCFCPACDWSERARTRGDYAEIPITVEKGLRTRIRDRCSKDFHEENSLQIALEAIFNGVREGAAGGAMRCDKCGSEDYRSKFAVQDDRLSDIVAIQGLKFSDDYLDAGDVSVDVEVNDGRTETTHLRLMAMILYSNDPKHYTAFIFYYNATDQVAKSSLLDPGRGDKPDHSTRLNRMHTLHRLQAAKDGSLKHLYFFEKR